jgi:hypothetical protein
MFFKSVIILFLLYCAAICQEESDFRIYGKLCDHGTSESNCGETYYTPWASECGVYNVNNWCDWIHDSDWYDPDAFRIGLEKYNQTGNVVLIDHDVRIGVQVADRGYRDPGNIQWTPYAYSGGGWSMPTIDTDGYDFDCVRLIIETKYHKGLVIDDIQLGVQLGDDKGERGWGNPRYTPWLISEHEGTSELTTDSDAYDPDAIKIKLNARIRTQIEISAQQEEDFFTFKLLSNYPNPFNPTTTIRYALPKPAFVNLLVYDINGKIIKNLVHENQDAGEYTISWSGDNNSSLPVASGVYFYRISADKYQATRQMLLLK